MSDQLHEDRFKMGLTRPFADRFNRFVENSGGAVEPLQGRMDPNEYKTVYNSLTQSDPELAAEMGNVHESPFIRGNAAMVHYPVNDQWAMKNASRYGLRLRPGFNNIVEPTGLRHKNRPTDFSTMSSDQIRNHLMEIIEGAVQPDIDDDRNPEALSLDAPLLANQSPTPQIDPTAFRDPDKARSSWDEAVDWWLSHNFDEDVPSGGGLMVGPQEMAKLGNFLKDALLPLMAGDVGLAGVGGLGRFDPLPIPFSQIVGKGVKGAKGAWRAIRGVDEAAEAVSAVVRAGDDLTPSLLRSQGFLGDARLAPTRNIGKGVTVSEIGLDTGGYLDRPFVVVRLPDGRLQPFYRSSGFMSEQPGKWFSFDGFGGMDREAFNPGLRRKGPYTQGVYAAGTPEHRYGPYREVSELLSRELGDAEPTVLFDMQKVSYDDLNEALGTHIAFEDYERAIREQIEAGATTANMPNPMRVETPAGPTVIDLDAPQPDLPPGTALGPDGEVIRIMGLEDEAADAAARAEMQAAREAAQEGLPGTPESYILPEEGFLVTRRTDPAHGASFGTASERPQGLYTSLFEKEGLTSAYAGWSDVPEFAHIRPTNPLDVSDVDIDVGQMLGTFGVHGISGAALGGPADTGITALFHLSQQPGYTGKPLAWLSGFTDEEMALKSLTNEMGERTPDWLKTGHGGKFDTHTTTYRAQERQRNARISRLLEYAEERYPDVNWRRMLQIEDTPPEMVGEELGDYIFNSLYDMGGGQDPIGLLQMGLGAQEARALGHDAIIKRFDPEITAAIANERGVEGLTTVDEMVLLTDDVVTPVRGDGTPIAAQEGSLGEKIDSLYEDAIEMLGGTSQRELGNVLGMPEGAKGYDAYGTVEGSDFTSKTNPEFWTPDEGTEIYEGRFGSAGLMDSTNPNTVAARDWWLGLDQEAKEAYHAIYRDVRGIDNSIAGRTLEDYEVMEMHQWHNPEADFPTLNVPADQLDVLTLDGLAEIRGVDPRDVTETHIQEAIDSGWAAPEEIAAIRKELEGLPGTPEGLAISDEPVSAYDEEALRGEISDQTYSDFLHLEDMGDIGDMFRRKIPDFTPLGQPPMGYRDILAMDSDELLARHLGNEDAATSEWYVATLEAELVDLQGTLDAGLVKGRAKIEHRINEIYAEFETGGFWKNFHGTLRRDRWPQGGRPLDPGGRSGGYGERLDFTLDEIDEIVRNNGLTDEELKRLMEGD